MACCANGTCTVVNCQVCTVKDRFVWHERTKREQRTTESGEAKMSKADKLAAEAERRLREWEGVK